MGALVCSPRWAGWSLKWGEVGSARPLAGPCAGALSEPPGTSAVAAGLWASCVLLSVSAPDGTRCSYFQSLAVSLCSVPPEGVCQAQALQARGPGPSLSQIQDPLCGRLVTYKIALHRQSDLVRRAVPASSQMGARARTLQPPPKSTKRVNHETTTLIRGCGFQSSLHHCPQGPRWGRRP